MGETHYYLKASDVYDQFNERHGSEKTATHSSNRRSQSGRYLLTSSSSMFDSGTTPGAYFALNERVKNGFGGLAWMTISWAPAAVDFRKT
jgi:hypothetical protein